MHTQIRRLGAVAACVVLGALLLQFVPARAQTTTTVCEPGPPDPYTGEQTPCEELRIIRLTLSITSGPPGTRVRLVAEGFLFDARVDITFGGLLLRTVTASQPGQAMGSAPVAVARPARALLSLMPGHGQPRAQTVVGRIDEIITIPDVAPGRYDVCVISPGSATACAPFQVTAPGAAPGAGGGGGFARTGLYLVPLVLIGVAVLVTGRVLRSSGRRRRKA
jgi:hypothetical protein